jgi:NAD(P)-dependent dehydrogenase (short-subunit alcohol dehydrogenase family)
MKGKLDGKVALISGVGEGIGGGIARRFAAEGETVACTGIQAEFFEAVTADIVSAGGHALSAVLNVESEDDWANAIAKTVEAFGRLDIVVNNAGVLSLASIEDTTLDEFRRVHAVNVDGTFLGIRQAIGAMRPGGLAGNGGSISHDPPCGQRMRQQRQRDSRQCYLPGRGPDTHARAYT